MDYRPPRWNLRVLSLIIGHIDRHLSATVYFVCHVSSRSVGTPVYLIIQLLA